MRNKEKDTINIVIGKHMAELRAKFNLSQKEIGQKLNYSQSKVSRLEEVALNILKKHYNSYT